MQLDRICKLYVLATCMKEHSGSPVGSELAEVGSEDEGSVEIWPLRIVRTLPSLGPQEAVRLQEPHLVCTAATSLHWSTLRRALRRLGVQVREHCGWLEVDPTDIDLREDALNLALAHGFAVVDIEGPELVRRVNLADGACIAEALRAIRRCDNGYVILEADAPSEAYVQIMLEGSEQRIEAAAGRFVTTWLGPSARARLARLRLLGFSPGTDAHPNYTRTLERSEPEALFAHLAQRALVDVYGLSEDASLRLRVFEDA